MLLAALLLAAPLVGCASQEQWIRPRSNSSHYVAIDPGRFFGHHDTLAPATLALLERKGLAGELSGDRFTLIHRLEAAAADEPLQDRERALSDLAYVSARNASHLESGQSLYSEALLHAHRCVKDASKSLKGGQTTLEFREATAIYNRAMRAWLAGLSGEDGLPAGARGPVPLPGRDCLYETVLMAQGWGPSDLDRYEFAGDYEIDGLKNHYSSEGLGAPLIAIRAPQDESLPSERFYPKKLCFPLTAYVRVVEPGDTTTLTQVAHQEPQGDLAYPDPLTTQHGQVRYVVELRDPTEAALAPIGGKVAPLATDLSTPLAYFLSQPEFREREISTIGLLNPGSVEKLQGVYLLERFDPDKIPVVLVHGLWSSPVTWMEMYNDLRSDPRIRDRFQFWFYLYPTGKPFWITAQQMREDLTGLRRSFDPSHAAPALDQMVLVGHSMGGLVSRLQTVDSGDRFWRLISDRNFEELVADEPTKSQLNDQYFFRPNPSVRRVVTIGTPHRGSEYSNGFTRWLGNKLIAAPMNLMARRRELFRDNPGFFNTKMAARHMTSIDSLSPNSPVLPALLDATPAPWVSYHNIIGRLEHEGVSKLYSEPGDGVVSLDSARLDGLPHLESQIYVPAEHVAIHRHDNSIAEVRRILLAHSHALQTLPYGATSAAAKLDQPHPMAPPTPGQGVRLTSVAVPESVAYETAGPQTNTPKTITGGVKQAGAAAYSSSASAGVPSPGGAGQALFGAPPSVR
ncbi:Alpha/beta hydrolase family protein [Pseudobythopirellula maris]|uniref:Alpha/beta hydrolase family protein n=1 Tax=Pseudobythopirellula maris TaxID=2527991 RepID=A0A5C5ZL91_9BACT|nr:Alpha/beta hydrolase family protein [Pseudobythopirellula maris]